MFNSVVLSRTQISIATDVRRNPLSVEEIYSPVIEDDPINHQELAFLQLSLNGDLKS